MKILIIRLSSLGDVILTQSVCAYLREQYPDAEIHYITKPAYIEIIQLMGLNILPIGYIKSLKTHLALFRARYDLVLDLHAKLASRLIAWAARGKKSAVYDKLRSIRKQIVSGNKELNISSTVDLYKSALTPFFDVDKLPAPYLVPPPGDLKLPLPTGQKLILIFPGAQHFTKMYPPEYYEILLSDSPSDFFYILAGSPGEKELCTRIWEHAPDKALNLAGTLSFGELLQLIQMVDLVISSDSGPMHLAAALRKAQIAIFGATHPRLGFAPMNPKAKLLVQNLDCQPCSLHGSKRCPLGHFNCMYKNHPALLSQLFENTFC